MLASFIRRIPGSWRYLVQAVAWFAFLFISTEAFVSVTVMSASKVGDYQLDVWGLEGYGVNLSLSSDEVWTPIDEGRKIVVMGDSFTVARQVMFDQNYVAVTEAFLQNRGYPIDLRNISTGNTSLPARIATVSKAKKQYDPIAYVIQTSYTDFLLESYNPAGWGYYFVFDDAGNLTIQKQKRNSRQNGSGNSPAADGFLSQFASSKLSRANEANREIVNDFMASVPFSPEERFAKQTQLLKETFRDVGLIVLILPTRIDLNVSPPRMIFSEEDQWLLQQFAANTQWRVVYPIDEFNALLARGVSPYGFGNSEPFHGHLNADGHAVLAGRLADAIEDMLK